MIAIERGTASHRRKNSKSARLKTRQFRRVGLIWRLKGGVESVSERSGRRTNERDRMGRVRAREVFRKRNGDIVREGREGKNQHTRTGGGGARREREEEEGGERGGQEGQ